MKYIIIPVEDIEKEFFGCLMKQSAKQELRDIIKELIYFKDQQVIQKRIDFIDSFSNSEYYDFIKQTAENLINE